MTEDLGSLSPEEIKQFVNERLQQAEKSRRSLQWRGVPKKARLWLALVPSLSPELADEIKLPVRSNSDEMLADLEKRGLLEAWRPTFLEDYKVDRVLYSMVDSTRDAVLEEYRSAGDTEEIRSALKKLGERIGAAPENRYLPESIKRWAQLAAWANSPDEMERFFDGQIEQHDRQQQPGKLLGWIEVGRSLADLFESMLMPGLQAALRRAARRLELLHRDHQDQVHLGTFLERPEQIDAIESLIDGPDELWALHLFGAGGVGKTMLLRHLTSKMARKQLRDHRVPTARVDFDYLNADYPRLAPGLLLWSFGQELRKFAEDNDAIGLLDDADRQLKRLHKSIVAKDTDLDMGSTRSSLFGEATQRYIDALRLLPQPVILVLDTCEELAKVHPEETVPENVTETFRILEALRWGRSTLVGGTGSDSEGLATLRVIFSGRRPLADSGYRWSCSDTRLQARPYLRLHELRGFSREDAEKYLRDKVKIPEDLIAPVIDRNPEPATASEVQWNDVADAPREQERFNPYDLKLYADWAKEDPPPDPATIRNSTVAQYVEFRILQRLGYEPLERVMPALALLKHMDRELLQRIGDFDDAASEQVFEQLQDQEWIESLAVGTRRVLAVKEGLRRRLWHYFSEGEGIPQDMLERATDHLEHQTLHEDLSSLDWTDFDAALRALEIQPERAASWWERVEHRILEKRDYQWLGKLLGSLLADSNAVALPESADGPDAPAVSRLRPVILASQAGVLLREDAAANKLGKVWGELLETVDRHPSEPGRQRLQRRALAGLVASQAWQNLPPDGERLAAFWEALHETMKEEGFDFQLVGSFVAAVEALLEYAEAPVDLEANDRRLELNFHDLARGSEELARRAATARRGEQVIGAEQEGLPGNTLYLAAFSFALAGRANRLRARPEAVYENFNRALAAADEVEERPEWDDWIPPENLRDRIRLEAIRGLKDWDPPERLLALVGPAPPVLDSADAERLASARMQIELRLRKPPLEPLLSALGWPKLIGGEVRRAPRATCQAHRWAPPLFVTAAKALAGTGRVDEACRVLRSVSSNPSLYPLEDLRHAERELLDIGLDWRFDDGDTASVSLEDSVDIHDRERVWALRSFAAGGQRSALSALSGAARHAVWRTRRAINLDTDGIVEMLNHPAPSGGNPFETHSLNLDRVEAALMTGDERRAEELLARVDPGAVQTNEDELTLLLRMDALDPRLPKPQTDITVLLVRVGARRAAEIALREGDLLALRLPEWAAQLYTQALRAYGRCDDAAGEFLVAVRLALLSFGISPVERTDLLATAERTYRAMSENQELTEVRLPDWNQLPARALAEYVGHDLWLECWHPMLERVVLAINLQPGAQNLGTLRRYVFGDVDDSSDALPADIAWVYGQIAKREAPADSLPESAESPSSLWHRIEQLADPLWRRLKTAGAFVLGLAIMAGMLYLGFKLFRWLVVKILSDFEGFGFGPQIASYIATLSVLGGLTLLIRKLPVFLLTALTVVRIRVDPVELIKDAADQSVPVRWHLSTRNPRIAWKLLPYLEYDETNVEARGVSGGGVTERYAELASGVPDVIVKPLRSLDPAILRVLSFVRERFPATLQPPFHLSLRIDPALVGSPWEALLQLAINPGWSPKDGLPVPCRRNLLGERARSPLPRSTGFEGTSVVLAADELSVNAARRAWRESLQTGDAVIARRLNDEESPAKRQPVAHLIGSIEDTSSGLRLYAGDPRALSREQSASESLEKTGPVALESSIEFVAARDLRRRFPDLVLCVLQGTLSRSSRKRLPSDRLAANLSRRFGAELHKLGVPIVLIVPPLEPKIAAKAMADIVELVGARHGSLTGRLNRCISQLQKNIQRQVRREEDGWEKLQDVCLYIEDA